MVREFVKRIRLYFCRDCGVLVSCTRKTRRNPGRVCQLGKCIDYARCRLRHIYRNARKMEALLFADYPGRKSFFRKYDPHLHDVKCDKCKLLDIKYGVNKKT